MAFKKITIVIALITCYFNSNSQDKKKWDINQPGTAGKDISFIVSEGTWMNLDVSPDGNNIVFDLLGDIYSIPISGGNATLLRQGPAFEVQPRYSPDGKKILFTSDAGGGDNIWVMDMDGKNATQITKESFRLVNNATWSPEGQYIIAKKHFTSTRSLGAGELWLYHTSGGDGLQLTVRKNDQQDLNEPCASPDGRYIYYSEDVYPGGAFQYNKDPNNQVFVIKRFDREKAVIEEVTGGAGGAARPQVSRDGKTLAFVKRVRTQSVLYLRNLETGEEYPVYDKLSKDQQEAWSLFGIYTGFSWMPGNKSIIIWSAGKIMKIEVNGANEATEIPFTCMVKQRITNVVRFKQDIDPVFFDAKVIRSAITSPDGKWLVFNAVGYLWKKELPTGKPERITRGTDPESEPNFSKDGKSLVYVTWNDTAMGAIYKIKFGAGQPERISSTKGIYRTPSFSPDGKWIVYSRENGNNIMGIGYTTKPGIYLIPANGGKEEFVSNKGEYPRFDATGERIYYQTGGNLFGPLNKTFGSYKKDGSDDRSIFKSNYASQFTVSPDGNWVAFVDLHEVYITTFPKTGKQIEIGKGSKAIPVKLVSKDAGINLHWSADSKQLHYTLGNQYFSTLLVDRFDFVAGKPDTLYKAPETGISVGLTVKTDRPSGTIAFTHARIITMNGNEVIENGTIIIEGNKISAIGKTEQVTIPANAKQVDCTGKTIMPGFIDAHAHGSHFRYGLTPEKHWPYYANLAYGVTTMHDPSAVSEMVFAQSELVRAGLMIGPRVFSTGTILYGADGDFKASIETLEDALKALRRSKAYGAFSVKSYNQPRREQRQMVIEAARQLKMEVVPEGGSTFFTNTSMILDGHTTIEHNMPVAELHDDVLQLWKNSGTAYTPTLIVSYGAVSGEYYWYQHTNVWEKQRLLRFTPRQVIDTRSRHRTMIPEEEYTNGHILISRSLKKLSDLGVLVNMGAHGQIQGIGAHWEIWMMAQGGMSPLEALRTATLNPAISLGLDTQIGSLMEGKLADLLVLDKNPLENIYNTESILYTMINGRLYDADSMNEKGNYQRNRGKFYWELSKNRNSFPLHNTGITTDLEPGDLD